MKKLLTAAVASTFAFLAMGVVNGDEINQGADFEAEGFVSGEAFDAALDDAAGDTGEQFWYTVDTEADNIISNYPSTGAEVPIASRPDKFASNPNSKYLRVETTGKLWRSVKNNTGSSDFLDNDFISTYGHSLTDAPIYLDTLVKFTPADGEFAADALSDGDKIAISYVEHEADTDGDESYTNFVIRAGLIVGQQLFQTNYFAYLPEDPTFASFDKDAWHRLTVRTIPEVGTSENPGGVGFVVYVDETPLAYPADVDAGFGTLNATAQGFYDNTKHALFPSAREAGAIGGKTISAASFSGNGSLDDVVFTTTTPTFIASSETPMVTVTWDTDVVSAITIAGAEVTGEDFAAGSKIVELEGAALAVTATPVGAYELVYSPTYENGEFTGLAAGDTCSITGFIPLFDVNGTHYATIDAAVTAAQNAGEVSAPAILKLMADIDGSLDISSGHIIIDLAGYTITGADGDDAAIMNNGASYLMITNSTVEIGHVVPGGAGNAITMDHCSTIVAGGSIDGGIDGVNDGPDAYLTITGGLFLDGEYDPGDPAFYLAEFVAAGLSVEYKEIGGNDYFLVGESGGSGDEDWPADPTTVRGETAGQAYGITGELASADAESLAIWAKGTGNVDFADKGTINIDCFLLNIANDSTAQQIQDEKDEFVVTISFDSNGDPVISAPDGKTYNGKLIIKGSDDLSIPKANWDEQTDGDTFFYGELSL